MAWGTKVPKVAAGNETRCHRRRPEKGKPIARWGRKARGLGKAAEMARPPVAAHHPRKGALMQALSDAGVGSSGGHGREDDRALAMSSSADRGLIRRIGILLGVSWEYHKSPSQPRLTYSSLMPRRLAVAFGSLAVASSAIAPAASMAAAYDPASDMNSIVTQSKDTN